MGGWSGLFVSFVCLGLQVLRILGFSVFSFTCPSDSELL